MVELPEIFDPGVEVLPGDKIRLVENEDQAFARLAAGYHRLLNLQTPKMSVFLVCCST